MDFQIDKGWVILSTLVGGEQAYWGSRSGREGNWFTDPQHATCYVEIDKMLLALKEAKAKTAVTQLDTVGVYKYALTFEAEDINNGDIMLRRQELAVGKLDIDDIEALGIKDLATLIKLREHK